MAVNAKATKKGGKKVATVPVIKPIKAGQSK
jgi:hypothetical protein